MTLTFQPSPKFAVFRAYVRGVQFGGYTPYVLQSTDHPYIVRWQVTPTVWQELRFTFNTDFMSDNTHAWRLEQTVTACDTRLWNNPNWVSVNATINLATPTDKKCWYISMLTAGSSKLWRINLSIPSGNTPYKPLSCPEILT